MKQAEIIDKNGFIVISAFVNENYDILFSDYKLKDGEKIINICLEINELVKPKWNGLTWEEGATKEEIEQYKNIEYAQ